MRLPQLVVLLLCTGVTATPADPPASPAALAERWLATDSGAAALAAARDGEPRVVEDQIALCEIPAPPFGEAARAAEFRRRLEATGVHGVRVDAVGNVIGERPGRGSVPAVVLSAHLDTVFPEGTDVAVRREGTRLLGPGIGDDCRGLAVLLGVVRAFEAGRIRTDAPLVVAATVGEEGLGDLRGVRHLFDVELSGRVGQFVSVDGAGSDIVRVAVGSFRYRVTFAGAGGHSWGAFGLPSPVHALGRAVAKLAALEVPSEPRTTFNVGRLGGGTSVNSIAHQAWFEVDLRSVDPEELGRLDARLRSVVADAVAEENARGAADSPVRAELVSVGARPAGSTPADAFVVRAAHTAAQRVGLAPREVAASTDANVPIAQGLPAVTIDGGGHGSGAHSPGESFDTTESWRGTQWATLLALLLAGPAD